MTFNLEKTFAVLRPDQSVELAPVTPTLYQGLDEKYDQFKGHTLVSMYRFESDWETWEIHPAGDELVVLLAGSASLSLRKEDGVETLELSEPGSYVLVPRNTWHTAHIASSAQMLFITPGEGTKNRSEAQ